MNYYGNCGGVLTSEIMPIILDGIGFNIKSDVYAIYGNITRGAIDVNNNEMYFYVGKKRLGKLPRYIAHEFAHENGANQDEAIEFADNFINHHGGDQRLFYKLLSGIKIQNYASCSKYNVNDTIISGRYGICCAFIDAMNLNPSIWTYSSSLKTIDTNKTITTDAIDGIKTITSNLHVLCKTIAEAGAKENEILDVQNDAVINGFRINEIHYNASKTEITNVLSELIGVPPINVTSRMRNRNIIKKCIEMINASNRVVYEFGIDYTYEIKGA